MAIAGIPTDGLKRADLDVIICAIALVHADIIEAEEYAENMVVPDDSSIYVIGPA
jgi:hypothetical protein